MGDRGVMLRGEGHPTDAALQEWSRFEEVRISGASEAAMRSHLEGCEGCRKLVKDFRQMDLMMHPFGSEPPVDEGPRRFKRALMIAGAVVVVVVAIVVLV